MEKIKRNNDGNLLISVNPYDVAEVHKRANSSYVVQNATGISFDPSKSSLIKIRSSNSTTRREKDTHKRNTK